MRKVLPNGLTVIVQEDHSHPLAAFYAVARTGSATEGRWMGTGVSHVVEHMLFKGTARRPVGEVEREAQMYGGTAQGYTTYDTTSYQLVVNKEFWSQTADLMVDALFFPSMDAEEFVKERQVVLRELKMRDDDPGRVIWDLLFENAYRVHPYRVPIIGYESLLTSLTRADVVEYHRERYVPNAIVFGVVGDVDAEQVIRRIEELTAKIPPGRLPPQPVQSEPVPVAPRVVVREADVTLGLVSIGFPGLGMTDPDIYALDLLAWILGGSRGSVLEKRLKETGIVHSVSCWNYTPQFPGLFSVSMRMDPANASPAADRAFEELARCRTEPFTAEEVESAKRAMLRGYYESRQTVGGQSSDLATYEALAGDPLFAHRYLEGVQRVTPQELLRVAVKYLQPERSTTVILHPKGAAPAAARKESAAEAKPAVQKVVLENGFRVLLRPDPRVPLVTFQLSMLGGVRYEQEQTSGISGVMMKMLLRGTSRRDAEQMIESVKKLGAEFQPFSGRNSVGLTMEVVREEALPALRLLQEAALEPSFPAAELEKEKRLAIAAIKASEEDAFSWGLRRLAATLFQVHPYRFDPLGDEAAVSRLTRDQLAALHKRVSDPRRMVLSVVGDFQPAELLPEIRQAFGRLSQAAEPPPVPQEPPLASPRERREPTPRNEGLILIGYPGLKVTDPRVPALDLLDAVLSGGAGRLFTEVREKQGLAYTVGAFTMHGVDPGSFVFYAMTDPAQLATVQKALKQEISRIGSEPVPAQELERARQGLLGARRVARQSQSSIAAQMSMDELFGLGYDFPERYEAQIKSLTPQQIQALAKELLSQPYALVIGHPGEQESDPAAKQPAEAGTAR